MSETPAKQICHAASNKFHAESARGLLPLIRMYPMICQRFFEPGGFLSWYEHSKPLPMSHGLYHPALIVHCMEVADHKAGLGLVRSLVDRNVIEPKQVKFFRVLLCLQIETARVNSRTYNWDVIAFLCDRGADTHVDCESLLAYDCLFPKPMPTVREIIFARGIHKKKETLKWASRAGGGLLAFLADTALASKEDLFMSWGNSTGLYQVMAADYAWVDVGHLFSMFHKAKLDYWKRLSAYADNGAPLYGGDKTAIYIIGKDASRNIKAKCKGLEMLMEYGMDPNYESSVVLEEPGMLRNYWNLTAFRANSGLMSAMDVLQFSSSYIPAASLLLSRGARCSRGRNTMWHKQQSQCRVWLLLLRTMLPADVVRRVKQRTKEEWPGTPRAQHVPAFLGNLQVANDPVQLNLAMMQANVMQMNAGWPQNMV